MDRIDNLICQLQNISDNESEVFPVSYPLLKNFSAKIPDVDYRDFLTECYEKFDAQFSEIITIYLLDRTSQIDLSGWKSIMHNLETPKSVYSVICVLWKYFSVDSASVFFNSENSITKKKAVVNYLKLNKTKLRVRYVDREDIAVIEEKYNIQFDFLSYTHKLNLQGAEILPSAQSGRQKIIDDWCICFS